MSKELLIRISVPDDAEIRVDVEETRENAGPDDSGGLDLPEQTSPGARHGDSVTRLIAETAPPRVVDNELRFIERGVRELELSPELPDSPNRRFEYVNLYPPQRFGPRRAAAFAVKSGRVEVYCKPEHASDFEHAEVVEHNNEPTWVRVYLTSDAAVDDAIALTALGLRER